MQFKKKLFLIGIVLLFLSPLTIIAQEGQKRFILVPFERFSFETAFDLNEMASVNELTVMEEAYTALRQKFIERIVIPLENYHFFELPQENQDQLLKNSFRYYKEDPITHYGYDITWSIESNYLNELLENLSADYIVFISQYKISKRNLVTPQSFDGSKFLNWSRHTLAYEVYDKQGNLVALSDGFEVKPKLPTDSTYETKGLLLSGLDKAYMSLQKDIVLKALKYTDAPIHRLKKKERWEKNLRPLQNSK